LDFLVFKAPLERITRISYSFLLVIIFCNAASVEFPKLINNIRIIFTLKAMLITFKHPVAFVIEEQAAMHIRKFIPLWWCIVIFFLR